MELKISKIGNSVGLILPKEILANLNLEKGDSLWLTPTEGGYNLTPYNTEFAETMEKARLIMKKRRNVLRELAK